MQLKADAIKVSCHSLWCQYLNAQRGARSPQHAKRVTRGPQTCEAGNARTATYDAGNVRTATCEAGNRHPEDDLRNSSNRQRHDSGTGNAKTVTCEVGNAGATNSKSDADISEMIQEVLQQSTSDSINTFDGVNSPPAAATVLMPIRIADDELALQPIIHSNVFGHPLSKNVDTRDDSVLSTDAACVALLGPLTPWHSFLAGEWIE